MGSLCSWHHQHDSLDFFWPILTLDRGDKRIMCGRMNERGPDWWYDLDLLSCHHWDGSSGAILKILPKKQTTALRYHCWSTTCTNMFWLSTSYCFIGQKTDVLGCLFNILHEVDWAKVSRCWHMEMLFPKMVIFKSYFCFGFSDVCMCSWLQNAWWEQQEFQGN